MGKDHRRGRLQTQFRALRFSGMGSGKKPTKRQQMSLLDGRLPRGSSAYRFGEELGHGDRGHLSKRA